MPSRFVSNKVSLIQRHIRKEQMKMKAGNVMCYSLLVLVGTLIPGVSFAQNAQDNPSITAQLNAAKPIVNKIVKDANELQSFSQTNGPGWETHAAVLSRIKNDVNKLQENMRGLQSHRATSSGWQQDAIDRVISLANDLAANMNAAIDQLNKSKTRPTASPYPEYLKANAQIAKDLSDEINGVIDYGQTKAKMDSLQKQLS
jgi:hypothetical protein